MFKDAIRCPVYHNSQSVNLCYDHKIDRWFVECPNENGCDDCLNCLLVETPRLMAKHLPKADTEEQS